MQARGSYDTHFLILFISILVIELLKVDIDDFSLLLIVIDVSIFLIHCMRR